MLQQQKSNSEYLSPTKPSGIPLKLSSATLKNLDYSGNDEGVPVIYGQQCFWFGIGSYLQNCLFLCGNTGNGKSHLAAGTLKIASKTGQRVLFIMADELFTYLNYMSQNQMNKLELIKHYLINYDILCIDGLERERFSDPVIENLFLIINKFYYERKKLIITTTFSPEVFKELDQRIYSRLCEMSIILTFHWEDYRIKGGPSCARNT